MALPQVVLLLAVTLVALLMREAPGSQSETSPMPAEQLVLVVRSRLVTPRVVAVVLTVAEVTHIRVPWATRTEVTWIRERLMFLTVTTVLAMAALLLQTPQALLALLLLLVPLEALLPLVSSITFVSGDCDRSPLPVAPSVQRLNGGGNAYSGGAGDAQGGRVANVADNGADITNNPGAGSGAGGFSTSGDATGGDAL